MCPSPEINPVKKYSQQNAPDPYRLSVCKCFSIVTSESIRQMIIKMSRKDKSISYLSFELIFFIYVPILFEPAGIVNKFAEDNQSFTLFQSKNKIIFSKK